MNNGFVLNTYKPQDYVLGGGQLPEIVLCKSKDWSVYLSPFEKQSNPLFESWSCSNFANCSITETMHTRLYGELLDYSEIFSSNMTGTIHGKGNSQINVAERTRKVGYIKEHLLPFTAQTTHDEYFRRISLRLRLMGLEWVNTHTYGYEAVRRQDMSYALSLSPLQVAVDSKANKTKDFRKYDHSVVVYADTGKKFLVLDTYTNKMIDYDHDYPFGDIMRFHYKKRDSPKSQLISTLNAIVNGSKS